MEGETQRPGETQDRDKRVSERNRHNQVSMTHQQWGESKLRENKGPELRERDRKTLYKGEADRGRDRDRETE